MIISISSLNFDTSGLKPKSLNVVITFFLPGGEGAYGGVN